MYSRYSPTNTCLPIAEVTVVLLQLESLRAITLPVRFAYSLVTRRSLGS